MFFDAHTHLNDEQLINKQAEIIKQCQHNSVKGIVNIGTNKQSSMSAVEIAHRHDSTNFLVKATVGIHPYLIAQKMITIQEATQDCHDLLSVVQEEKKNGSNIIVGRGECGIDTHYEGTLDTLDLQQECFAQQCDIAQQLNLPIVIHSRSHFDATLDVLKAYRSLPLYFHCRGYEPEQIRQIFSFFNDVWIGFCGNVTYPKAQYIRNSFAATPLDRIVIETDSPYLAPQGLRGTVNTPANIGLIYQYCAELASMNLPDFATRIQQNFCDLYRIPHDSLVG